MNGTIHTQELDNGLVLLAEPMESVESAAFTLRLPAGTALEPAAQGGLAGMTCDLSMRGAGARDNRQLVTELDNLGVERDESVSTAHVSYSGATLAKHLPAALSAYADIVRRPRLPEQELDAVRQSALQELQAVEDEPGQKVMMELRRRHYPDPWGRSSHGTRAAVEAMTADDIRGYVHRHFRPNGAILGVAGRVDWPSLRSLVENLFGDWSPGEAYSIDERPTGPARDHVPHDSNQTQIAIAHESVPYCHEDYFQAWGAVGVLSGGMSSRLFTEVREKRGLCYSVHATLHSLRDRGCLLCYAGTSADRAQETLDVTIGELLRLSEGVQARELARLKARMKSALIMQQESSSARSGAIARDWYYLGRVRTLDEVSRLVDGVSSESINAFLKQHPPRGFTIVTLGPRPLEMPSGIL